MGRWIWGVGNVRNGLVRGESGWSTFEEREAKAMMNCLLRIIFNKNIVAEIGISCLLELGGTSRWWRRLRHICRKYNMEELEQLSWYAEHMNENGLRMMRVCERESYWKKEVKERIELEGRRMWKSISGRDYSVEEIGNLPKDLHPNNFAVKQNEQWLIFGGIHSRYYFLSNFYKVPLTYKNIEFEDLETAYQYAKASTFNDHVSCENILCSTSPSAAKHIGGSIKNFKSKDWDKVKQDIMLELLRIKFIPGSDLAKRLVATSGKSLAEAGQSGVYSIGMTLNNKELFDTQKWTKNVLGELLMKVRQELM